MSILLVILYIIKYYKLRNKIMAKSIKSVVEDKNRDRFCRLNNLSRNILRVLLLVGYSGASLNSTLVVLHVKNQSDNLSVRQLGIWIISLPSD